MKRKYWPCLVSVVASSFLLFSCATVPPKEPSTETPIIEPTETPVETNVETEVETPAEEYTLAPLETPDKMSYDNIKSDMNAMTVNLLQITKKFDLNSDGQEEEIVLIARDFVTPDALPDLYEGYELIIGTLEVRGYSASFEPRFNIVDLDKTDRYREIAVSEYGESEDPATTFIRYDGTVLEVIGTIPGFYGKRYVNGNPTEGLGKVSVDGSGIVKTLKTSFFLMTWNYEAEYQLEDGQSLTEIKKDLYPMNHQVTMLTDLTLKKSRTDSTDGITLKKGDVVTLKECDNAKWVSVMNTAGEIGWFALDEKDTIIGTGKTASEVFDGLFIAG
ncbi:hypothetical protein KCG48_10700 [Proteiniclasticum sp. BAD-10]|uniref:SH3 domain-containing protein n=1 Tax=Proteiniclasticum sediminis TaxID=2804028 RepID=A0A941CSY4_9CLOT|nr:SH3 domain-containing protein [Proteiniclasticum sediminis]MBR0576801.1 hypothetical protein [Proteiniclasticum sediminis]